MKLHSIIKSGVVLYNKLLKLCNGYADGIYIADVFGSRQLDKSLPIPDEYQASAVDVVKVGKSRNDMIYLSAWFFWLLKGLATYRLCCLWYYPKH